MLRLILTRLALFVPTLFAASVILFIAINVVPGSAARSALGVDATPQAIMRFEALNGLDRPLAVQYTEWLGKALRGDLGTSFQNRVAVAPDILKRLPVTLELAVLAFLIANLIALPLGAIAAFRHRKAADVIISALATILGGRVAGLSHAAATEFSFLVGLLTLSAASIYKMWALGPALTQVYPAGPASVGLLVAAVTAFVSVKWLVGYVSRNGLGVFAWYRIALGGAILAILALK